jgi:hypothetical protein
MTRYFLQLLFCIALISAVVIEENDADIIIAGGSLSALAAAITAANLTKSNTIKGNQQKIILIEPTNWPGGQLTASNVPPDFGPANSVPENLPRDFVNLLLVVAGPTWKTNPGKCWVSYKCFQAQNAAEYIKQLLAGFPSLKVYYNAVIRSSTKTGSRITQITAIQRTPKGSTTGYEGDYSDNIVDWYSASPSHRFDKQTIVFNNFKVAIEATEYADVLMTSAYPSQVSQGVETPDETSDETVSVLGQSMVFPFHIYYNTSQVTDISAVPVGSDNGQPFSLGSLSWPQAWTYRRVLGLGDDARSHVFDLELSNQNLDNDYAQGYLFLSQIDAQQQAASSWAGGLNITSLRSAEQRSFGWFRYLLQGSQSLAGIDPHHLSLSSVQAETSGGLAKMPYVRDTRRAKYGLERFRLTYADLNYSSADGTARRFADTVGIGHYLYADIHVLKSPGMVYPAYITCCEHPINPYYVPFRALTVEGFDNLLCAGKTMAQSFLANAATRLHPTEWSSGAAAGAAAFLMSSMGGRYPSTAAVYKEVGVLQTLLQSDVVKSPLTWTLESAQQK